MLALKIEFLTGVYMAVRHDDPTRSSPEWPPHPDRLYSALVAAAANTPGNSDGRLSPVISELQRLALQWLLDQGAPQIAVSEARPRSAPDVYMPSNPHEDEVWQKPKEGSSRVPKKTFNLKMLLPAHRKKAALAIPAIIPDEPVAYFIWPEAKPEGYLDVLKAICQQVTYLGRSRSLVRVSTVTNPPMASLVPSPLGAVQLRVPSQDRLEYLVDKYEHDGGKPEPSPPHRYQGLNIDTQQHQVRNALFERMYIFRPRQGDPSLQVEATVTVTQAMRLAVISCVHDEVCGCGLWGVRVPNVRQATECYRKIPAIISGHESDCSVTKRPHIAFVALPFVHPLLRYANGEIKGVGVLVPRQPSEEELQILAAGLLRLENNGLHIPNVGTWQLREVPADDPPIKTLDSLTWAKPSCVWTSVTPMVFGHFPKKSDGGEPKIVLDSLRMIGIDSEIVNEIAVGRHSPLHGTPPSWYFKTRRDCKKNEQPPRLYRHVTLRFGVAVRGPIVLGWMRFFGLGLMSPLEEIE